MRRRHDGIEPSIPAEEECIGLRFQPTVSLQSRVRSIERPGQTDQPRSAVRMHNRRYRRAVAGRVSLIVNRYDHPDGHLRERDIRFYEA